MSILLEYYSIVYFRRPLVMEIQSLLRNAQISCDQGLCFLYIVQCLFFLNEKFQASNHLLWLYIPVFIGPVRKHQRNGSLCLPPVRVWRHIVFPLASVCPSVCPSVCLSVTKSCPLYNLITVTDISTKLHTFVKLI